MNKRNNTSVERLRAFWPQVMDSMDVRLPAGFMKVYFEWTRTGNANKPASRRLRSFARRNPVDSIEFRREYLKWCHPHIEQVFRNGDRYHYSNNIPFTRTTEILDELDYLRRRGQFKSVIHWGQRKLFLSEVEFLTRNVDPEKKYFLAYAGAAPGNHIQELSDMFPNVYWYLVDPKPFRCRETPLIERHQCLFTDDTCGDVVRLAQERGEELLFISDIRSADWLELNNDQLVEELVGDDMDSQQRWYEMMDPIGAMFKFRLPWEDGETEYLDGEVHLPVFGPITTTEARLIVGRKAGKIMYDNREHERKMFWFNTVMRTSTFPGICPDPNRREGQCNCYDCSAEYVILRGYVEKYPRICTAVFGTRIEGILTERISRSLGDRHLYDKNPDPEERRRNMDRRSNNH